MSKKLVSFKNNKLFYGGTFFSNGFLVSNQIFPFTIHQIKIALFRLLSFLFLYE